MSLRTLQLDTSWGQLTVAGGSRAGEATVLVLPQLRLALEAGRPHRALPPMSTVCLSHGHMDHVGGLGYWASQRFLNSMGPARVIVPEAIADDVVGLLAIHARLEGGRPYDVEVVSAAAGSVLQLRRDLDLEPFATDHWVPTLGSLLVWRRRRLRAELVGRSHHEIAAMRARGEQVSEEHRVDLLAYCADTGPGLFSRHGGVLGAEVVLLECSFFKPADRERARRFGHLHLDDLLALAPELRCRHLILLHGSRRHRMPEIESMLEEKLRPKLECALHHLMVDWE